MTPQSKTPSQPEVPANGLLTRFAVYIVGSPFAAEKQQTMQSEGTFLGLTHDFSVVSHSHCVNFGLASDSTTRSRTSSAPPATLSACPKALPQEFME